MTTVAKQPAETTNSALVEPRGDTLARGSARVLFTALLSMSACSAAQPRTAAERVCPCMNTPHAAASLATSSAPCAPPSQPPEVGPSSQPAEPPTASPQQLAAAPSPPPQPSRANDRWDQVSTTEFVVERQRLNALRDDVRLIEARLIVGSDANGQFHAQLFGIRPDGVAGRLGFINGDRIVGVSGTPLSDPEQARAVFETALTKDIIVLDVERRGQLLELTYHLQ